MSNGYGFGGGNEVKEESSWRYPIGIFFAILFLSAIFLYYYVGPSVDEFKGDVPSPAISEEKISVTVGGHTFATPANFTVYPRARRGGVRDELSLYMLWPTKTGYSPANRKEFIENAPDTRRINIDITNRPPIYSEGERIEKLYLPQTVDPAGAPTPYKLTKFVFKEQRADVPTNGYADSELFVGADANDNLIALFCFKERGPNASPDCWRTYEYSDKITVSYRFKRPYLPEWPQIDAEVRQFVADLDQSENDLSGP
ncbi:MAG: hypothetical protein HKN14_05180 [Marinicaulis sp.]|nr:hypothetical protein [Marinicaulis sp.]